MSNKKIYEAWNDYKNKNVYIKKSKFCRDIGCSVDLLNKSIRFFEDSDKEIVNIDKRDSRGRYCINYNIETPSRKTEIEMNDKKVNFSKEINNRIYLTKKFSKRTPEEQIAFIQKSLSNH